MALQEIAKIEDEFAQAGIGIQLRDAVAELAVFAHELIDDRRAFRRELDQFRKQRLFFGAKVSD